MKKYKQKDLNEVLIPQNECKHLIDRRIYRDKYGRISFCADCRKFFDCWKADPIVG